MYLKLSLVVTINVAHILKSSKIYPYFYIEYPYNFHTNIVVIDFYEF